MFKRSSWISSGRRQRRSLWQSAGGSEFVLHTLNIDGIDSLVQICIKNCFWCKCSLLGSRHFEAKMSKMKTTRGNDSEAFWNMANLSPPLAYFTSTPCSLAIVMFCFKQSSIFSRVSNPPHLDFLILWWPSQSRPATQFEIPDFSQTTWNI